MDWLYEYSVPVIMGICLCVGYMIKHSLDFIPNKYIPTIIGCLGLVISVAISPSGVTPVAILQGLFSGLSSTGVHQAFKNYIKSEGGGE